MPPQKGANRRLPGEQDIDLPAIQRVEHHLGRLRAITPYVKSDRGRNQAAYLQTIFDRRVVFKTDLDPLEDRRIHTSDVIVSALVKNKNIRRNVVRLRGELFPASIGDI